MGFGIEDGDGARHARRDFLEQLEHLPPIVGSKLVNPVRFVPGRARLATRPLPIGFATCKNTIGAAAVSWRNATTAGVLSATMTSGERPVSSFACARIRFGSPAPKLNSMTTLRPSDHPSLASACWNAVARRG